MSSAFPAPRSIATPAGCEGWEEMYPHYALFEDTRAEADAGRLWFWNSMHFPVPMPAFDVASIDGPYYALGAWQNRAFAVPIPRDAPVTSTARPSAFIGGIVGRASGLRICTVRPPGAGTRSGTTRRRD